ncbi:hypothetical protein AAHC03_016960 [Spirometra sp. Aus1]
MAFVPFAQLALKWGIPSEGIVWTCESNFTDVEYKLERHGGDNPMPMPIVWTPVGCSQPETVALVIPVRYRYVHLSVFLNHIHPFLRHQRQRYTIYVIEQVEPKTFDKGALLNIGYREALKAANYSCFIFHDVDLLPEDDRMLYACEHQPLHMTAFIDKFNYS